ncbi:MAG TPA: ATP-binding protein, partial [Gemmatimonadales bacterium]|nr:ATP-binding protein [Gemmatimonadales bacterium]
LRDAEGRPYRMIGAMSDVTAQREAEAALRRSEEQLRQAQKMEAVGRLAGGVAHDFNNLLTSMLGYADLVLAELPAGHPVRADVEEIQRAGQRAASLTRQLLAFSRRQVTRPRPVSLNTVVLDVERMLRRLLGEDVRLTLELAPRLGTVLADPAQLEQVIVNLAVNARDAMPEGGELSIATADVELTEETVRGYGFGPPGPYVTLTVRDTGVGMSEEVKARIFEPFFTTKELGRGTGLGLATVYGIVKQFGGYIWVESAPGQGSTFTVFFPRVRDTGSESAPEHPGTVPTGTERILLVEDEPAVRGMARRALEALGYRVVEAESGAEALARLAGAGAIDLLVTDVIMADVTGPELAMRIRQERPGLRVLFISGYPDTLRARQVELMPDAAYLQKPFTPDILGRAVRAVLDAAEPGTG